MVKEEWNLDKLFDKDGNIPMRLKKFQEVGD